MTTTTNHSKALVAGLTKGQGNARSFKQVAMTTKVEVQANSHLWYWKCGKLGHAKKDCPLQTSSDDKIAKQSSADGGKGNVTYRGQQSRLQGQGKITNTPPKCTHPLNGWIGHTEAQYQIKIHN